MSHIDRYYAEESERRGFQLLLYNLEPTGRGKMNEMWRGEKERKGLRHLPFSSHF